MDKERVEGIATMVAENWRGLGRGTLRLLREGFPGVAFVAVSASDVTEKPFRSLEDVDLHYINTADHCASIVYDAACAGGILLAIKETT